ncbi:hypothetical protein C4587_02245 [Candidatus Parcubacteria bacterium]|nr:MAG: hypothetical protein C4587_02245 [Candidatus Parcubacteria bacterium]
MEVTLKGVEVRLATGADVDRSDDGSGENGSVSSEGVSITISLSNPKIRRAVSEFLRYCERYRIGGTYETHIGLSEGGEELTVEINSDPG